MRKAPLKGEQKIETLQQNRFLLLRFYLLLATGLIATAALLDFGYSRYFAAADTADDEWLQATLRLIVQSVPDDADLDAHAQQLSARIGHDIQLFAGERFAEALPQQRMLFGQADSGEDVVWFRSSSGAQNGTARDIVVQLVLPPLQTGWTFADAIPVLFYIAIFVIVGFWLAPLIRDLNRLSASARRFSADYRQPLAELAEVTHLTGLADNLQLMSARIRQLIVTQQDLTNGLSHEIRTPLARMKFALAVADDSAAPGSEEQSDSARLPTDLRLDLAQDIHEIDSLITAMLDYARLDQSSLELDQSLVATAELFAPVLTSSHKELNTESGSVVAVSEQRDAKTLTQVRCDPYLMELAISNLVVNAGRYARTCVHLSCVAGAADEVVIRVDDDGPGVAVEQRSRIFAAFQRPDAQQTAERGGFGLGLAIVARVARMHGGWVRVVDAPLGGARFELGWSNRGD